MQDLLQEIVIRGLHDRLDITIPVKENRLILVGVNGLGKTTVVNALFYFLSRQWTRLKDISFEEMSITIGDQSLTVSRKMLAAPPEVVLRMVRRLPRSVRTAITEDSRLQSNLLEGNFRLVEEYFGMPPNYLRRRLGPMKVQPELFEEEADPTSSLSNVDRKLEDLVVSQVLYMPTYRRIEQDLQELFRNFDEDIRRRLSRTILRRQTGDSSFTELIQFGMEDVENMIAGRIDGLKERARVELNELAGSYLRDVIRGDAEKYQRTDIDALDDEEVDRILERVEEETLPRRDKNRLRRIIRSIRSGQGDKGSAQERYLAHFFSKVVEMYRSQQERESSLRHFVELCNRYLEGKRVEYNDSEYSLRILGEGDVEIELGQLSSGEKQVISLFSHVYLSTSESFFAVIDEPELSLSVDWQRRLLPDLWDSGRCRFLAAVTHSPFIYNNSLEEYATDLRSCTTVR